MDLITLSWIDYIFFCIVFGGSCLVGLYFGCCGNRQETKTDYLLGGRKMAVIPVAVSLIASTLSSTSLLGIPTEIYLYGTQYWLMCVCVLIAGLLTIYIFLPVYYKLGITTLYEYFEIRFNIHVRRVVSFVYLLDCMTLMPCLVYAPALALNQMSGFSVHLIACVLAVVCVFYTTLGGLRGVVWSSTLQFCITLSTLCAVIVLGSIGIGWTEIWNRNNDGGRIQFLQFDPDPTMRATFWSVTIGNIFIWLNYTATNPAAIQRLLSLPTLSGCRKSFLVYIAGTMVAKSLCCITGLILFAKYYNCDPFSAGYIEKPDQILPYYVLDVAANISGISGLFVAAICSTALSALSSLINTLAGTIYIDLIEKCMPKNISERVASNIIRGISIILGFATVGCVFVIERLGTILQLMVSFSGIVAGPPVGICILGMFFPFTNSKGALSGAITAITVMWIITTGRYIQGVDNTEEYLPKPLSTNSCNISTVLSSTYEDINEFRNEPFWLFKISFYYYSFLGVLITVVVGLAVSWFTKKNSTPVSLNMCSPLVHRFIKNNVNTDDTNKKKNYEQDGASLPFLQKSLGS